MCYVTNRTTHIVNSARSMMPSGKTPLHKVWSICKFAVCMCVFYVPQHRVDHTSLYCMYSIQVHVTQLIGGTSTGFLSEGTGEGTAQLKNVNF